MKKHNKILSFILATLTCVSPLSACSDGGNRDEIKTPTKEIINLSSQTELASSVTYSNKIANAVQGYFDSSEYEDGNYVVKNSVAFFSHALKGGNKTVAYYANSRGENYLESTMDVYVVTAGEKQYAKKSAGDARINTTNLGYYYYTVNVRDLTFDGVPCYLEKIYHTYSDRVNEQFRIVSSGTMTDTEAFGFEVKVRKGSVSKYEIYDGNGYSSSAGGFNENSVEYVALDVENAGVIGFIFTDKAYKVTVTETDKYLIIRQEVAVNADELTLGEDLSFGNRIYNDETHSFEGIRAASKEERTPLGKENVSVKDEDGAKFIGYDYLKGCYEFYLNGTDFYTAYYKQQEKKFLEKIEIKGDDTDRNIYIYVHTDRPLEGAAVLDENGVQVPVPVQVSKNFGHEKEEPIYDPYDPIYGDSYLPLVVEKNSVKKLTVVNVYQKWGKFDIKQLSSISYYVSYYHLSTGVHETNCIAPYYALKGPSLGYASYGNSWFMPDFRSASGEMWQKGDPQFSSAGMLMSVCSDDGGTLCDYLGSDIKSSGLTYADMDYSFVSEDGAYEYTMRHVEMPQNDEARTYYEISVKFLKDTFYEAGTFSLASFNGRNCTYKYSSYLGEDGEEHRITNKTTSGSPQIYKLQNGSSFFTLYGINEENNDDRSNFGLIVKDNEITVNGEKTDGLLGYLNDWRNKLNFGSLTLSEDVSFKKGDTIKTDVIFLSYGTVGQEHCDNVRKVYNDSVVNPVKLSAFTGKVVEDKYIPTIEAENNMAQFTVSGGVYGNDSVNYTVKIKNCDRLARPKVYEYLNGEWTEYDIYGEAGYDGYSVICEDGKLTYSFVFAQNASGRMFRFAV